MHVSTVFIFVSIQLEKINIKATAFTITWYQKYKQQFAEGKILLKK